MRQWIWLALVQIMACRLFGAMPISKPMLDYCQLALRNKFQWHLNQNTKLFIHENAFEYILCEMAAILSREWWVNNMAHNLTILPRLVTLLGCEMTSKWWLRIKSFWLLVSTLNIRWSVSLGDTFNKLSSELKYDWNLEYNDGRRTQKNIKKHTVYTILS